MEVWLMRHAESIGQGKILQLPDEPLSENGLKQISEIKDDFPKDFDKVICSNMKRAIQTAESMGFKHYEVSDIIHEKRNGKLEGQEVNSIDWTEINKEEFESRRIPGGESLTEVLVRAEEFLEFLKTLDLKKVLVVTHGTFIRVIISIITGKSLEEVIKGMKINNLQIVKINEKEGIFTIVQ